MTDDARRAPFDALGPPPTGTEVPDATITISLYRKPPHLSGLQIELTGELTHDEVFDALHRAGRLFMGEQ